MSIACVDKLLAEMAVKDAQLTAANRELERLSQELDRANDQLLILTNRMNSIQKLATTPLPGIESRR